MPYGKGADRAFAIATAAAKQMGFKNFVKGSRGSVKRKHVAEGVSGMKVYAKKKSMSMRSM